LRPRSYLLRGFFLFRIEDEGSKGLLFVQFRVISWIILRVLFAMNTITRKTVLFPLLVILLLVHPLNSAQTQTRNQRRRNTVVALFDRAAAKHKRELQDLWLSRALPRVQLANTSSRSLAAALAQRGTYEAAYLAGTSVLFYSYDQDALSIWLLDEHGIQAYEQKRLSREQIAAAIKALRDSLEVDSLQALRTPHKRRVSLEVARTSTKLPINQAVTAATNILLPPSMADALASVQHLIVVPVLGIGTVPFAILRPFGPNAFLIDKMSISVAPSLFDIGQAYSSWNSHFSFPLVVGNPFVPPGDEWVIPDLPGAEVEAAAVATALHTKALVGKEATKQVIPERALQSDILYLATHGVASSDDPLSGGFLLLSAPNVEQGKWTAREVQQMRLDGARIVVLSACQTGLGKVHDAGIIGLARAFQIAGSPRVVMSLWSVNDDATNELMQTFMSNLRIDIPAEALRKAMIKTRANRPHPSDWASFVLFGTPR
jgi:CHAT domain-containing protein